MIWFSLSTLHPPIPHTHTHTIPRQSFRGFHDHFKFCFVIVLFKSSFFSKTVHFSFDFGSFIILVFFLVYGLFIKSKIFKKLLNIVQ